MNNNGKGENVIVKVSESSQKFINSPLSLFLFPGTILIFGILNLFAFGFLGIEVYSPWINNYSHTVTSSGEYAWLGWLAISISMLGGTISILGTLLIIRLDRNFIWPILIGQSLIIMDAVIAGYVFTGLSYVIMVTSSVYSWWTWGKVDEGDSSVSMMNYKWWIVVLTTVIIYLAIGSILSLTTQSQLIDPTDKFTWIDLTCSAVVVGSWIVMNKKDKSAFAGFITTDIIYLFAYFAMGYWATGVYYFVYIFSDTASMFSWVAKDIQLKEMS